MGLRDAHGEGYALGLAADEGTVRRLETDLAVSGFLIGQSPVGLAVFDTELRWLRANPALQRMNSITEPQVRGLRVGEALPGLDCEAIEAAMRHVLESGEPLLDQQSIGRTPPTPTMTTPGRSRTTDWRTPVAGSWASPSPSWTSPDATGRPARSPRRASGWP